MKNSLLLQNRDHKTSIALDWDTMHRLRGFLLNEFGIRSLGQGSDINSEIESACGRNALKQLGELNNARMYGRGRDAARADNRFFDLISRDPLFGLVHSQKWPFIYDVAAYILAIARVAQCEGPFLDIGCHGGYHALWLAREMGIPGKGLDRSAAAIRYARRVGAKLGLTPGLVSFENHGIRERVPDGGYRLMYSSDGPVFLSESSLRGVAEVMASNGLFLWFGGLGGTDARSVRLALEGAGLSLVLADVVGGWDGTGFSANGALVMMRGESAEVGDDLLSVAESIWDDGFRNYCNSNTRRPEDKTLSLYRTHSTYGER